MNISVFIAAGPAPVPMMRARLQAMYPQTGERLQEQAGG